MTAVAAFQLTAPATGVVPFRIGHAFRKGDVPAGQYAHLDLPNFSVAPLRYWNDGSLKHAMLIGRVSLTANVALQVNIVTRSTAPVVGTPLTAASITAAAPTATADFAGIGSVSLASLLATPTRTWISTKEMVECHYQSMVGSDTSLYVKFHVRMYFDGRMKVDIITGNGKIGGSNAVKNAVPTMTIGGTVVFNNGGLSRTHSIFARYRVSGWIGGNPQVRPKHDTGYLNRTKLVPNIDVTGASSAALAYLAPIKSYVPGATYPVGYFLGFTSYMPDSGYQDSIGLLPRWDALYLSMQAHPDAYDAVIAHGDAINEYAFALADPTTLGPIRLADFPTWSAAGAGSGAIDGLTSAAGTWEQSHCPSSGYLAYLLTADYYFLETVQFTAKMVYLCNDINGGLGVNRLLRSQNRARAWGVRSISHAAAIVPDAATAMLDVITWMGNIATARAATYTTNPAAPGFFLGYEELYSNRIITSGSTADDGQVCAGTAPWEHHFNAAAWGMALDIEPVPTAQMAPLSSFADYLASAPTWITGGNGANEFNFGYACAYTVNFRANPATTTPYNSLAASEFRASDPGQVFTDTFSTSPSPLVVNSANNVLTGTSGGNPGIATGYWANLKPALAYAVDHGKAGALAGFNRIVGASNYVATQGNAGYADTPQWSVSPRSYYQPALLFSAIDLGAPMTTTGPSIRVGNGGLFSTGGIPVGTIYGLGITAAQIPTGSVLPALLLNDVTSVATDELLLEILTVPSAGTLTIYPGSDFSFVAPDGSYPGTEIVKVNGVADSGPYTFNIGQAVATVSGVVVSPASATGSTTFAAVVNGSGNPSQAVTWSLTGAGAINTSTGAYTAPAATTSVQNATVRATSVLDANKSGTASVTIAAASASSTVTSVTVSPTTAALIGGATQSFAAAIAGTGNPSQGVNWTTTIGTISAGGVLTAPAATTAQQSGTVRATSQQNGTVSGTAAFTVAVAESPTVSGVAVTPVSLVMSGNATQAFSATVSGTNSPSQGVTWATTIGSINPSTGVLTAPFATSSSQSGTVTARSTLDSTKSGSASITVAAAGIVVGTVTSVAVTPASGSINAGGTRQFSAVVSGTNSPSQDVTWAASAGTIAGGLFTPPAATSSTQAVTITATSVIDGSKVGTAVIYVNASAAGAIVADGNMLELDASGNIANPESSNFYLRGRQIFIDKDPDAIMYYGLNMAAYLARAANGISIVDAEALVSDVDLTINAAVQGAKLVAQIGGGSGTLASLDNTPHCTFRFTLSNGDVDDFTIWFNITDR